MSNEIRTAHAREGEWLVLVCGRIVHEREADGTNYGIPGSTHWRAQFWERADVVGDHEEFDGGVCVLEVRGDGEPPYTVGTVYRLSERGL